MSSPTTVQIHTFYNTSIPDTSPEGKKQAKPRINKDTKLPVLDRNGDIIMNYPRKKDANDKSMYSNNIQVVFLATSTIPESLSATKVLSLAKSAKDASRPFQYTPKVDYEIQWTSAEYEILLEDGTTAKVYKTQFNPIRAKFVANLSW